MVIYIILVSCGRPAPQTNDLSEYYFPINTFSGEGMQYTYRNLADSTGDKEVWRHTMLAEGLLESINYDYRQEIVQKQYDRIISNGVLTDSLVLFFRDSLGKGQNLNVIIHSPYRFPFEPGDSTKVWLTHLEWWQPEDSLHVVLQRRRRFIGHTTWKNNGKEIPAVRFRTEDSFETERDGWTTSSWSGEEVYAKRIGLVYYKRNISDQLKLEFELESRK